MAHGLLVFPIYLYIETSKIFLSETTGPILIYIRIIPLMTLYQDCSRHDDFFKNMAAVGEGGGEGGGASQRLRMSYCDHSPSSFHPHL